MLLVLNYLIRYFFLNYFLIVRNPVSFLTLFVPMIDNAILPS